MLTGSEVSDFHAWGGLKFSLGSKGPGFWSFAKNYAGLDFGAMPAPRKGPSFSATDRLALHAPQRPVSDSIPIDRYYRSAQLCLNQVCYPEFFTVALTWRSKPWNALFILLRKLRTWVFPRQTSIWENTAVQADLYRNNKNEEQLYVTLLRFAR